MQRNLDIAQVVQRKIAGHAADGSDVTDVCRTQGCHRPADGLDGFCKSCSCEKERSGAWRTPQLPFGP